MGYFHAAMDGVLARRYEHPRNTHPKDKVCNMHSTLQSLKETRKVHHPLLSRSLQPLAHGYTSPSQKEGKKTYITMAVESQRVIDEYAYEGLEVTFTDESSEHHPM